ncbi:hypothetical protein CPC16_011506 [Podila verticillata]|nr:hypothetical protein CPC16_011506 [Podila verticillata]KAI9237366.1 MAG: hypothetical protein BYD32DRAFT_416682 [Podila humilis]
MTSPIQLPEIITHIARFLPFEARVAASQVSQLWRSVVLPIVAESTLHWQDTLPQESRDALLATLSSRIQSLECDFTIFKGKALYYNVARQEQIQKWVLFKRALTEGKAPDSSSSSSSSNELSIEKLTFRYGNFPDEDLFPILLEIKTLHHLAINTGGRRDFTPDLSKLFKILAVPSLQKTLRKLSVTNAWWPNTGLPFPNKVRCQLTHLHLNKVRDLTAANLGRLFESCPELESLECLNVLANWPPPVFRNLSKYNPKLTRFVFSVANSTSSDSCVTVQLMSWLVSETTQNLTQLGVFRLDEDVSTEVVKEVLARFPDLEKWELHQTPVACYEHLTQVAKEAGHPVHVELV